MPPQGRQGTKARRAARFAWDNFGPLILFYGTNHFYGLKPAIAVSTAGSVLEIAHKLLKREEITTAFKFTAAMTLVFGAVDLCSRESFLFRYEPAITNFLTAGFFGWSLRGGGSLLADVYRAQAKGRPITEELSAYFRGLTLIWLGYFLAKSAAYAWMARVYTIEQGFWIRTIVGTASLYAMLGLSFLGGRVWFARRRRKPRRA